MKFICEHCKTKYSIADEKVKRKVLKIRCKNCSNIIVVQEGSPEGSVVEPIPGGGRVLERAVDSPFRTRSSFGGPGALVQESGLHADDLEEELGHEPTRLSDSPPLLDRGLRLVEDEWYLAVEGKQYGPMALSELGSRIKRGETNDEAYVWRDGFDNWLEIAEVPELRSFIPRQPPPPPPAKSGLLPLPRGAQGQVGGLPHPQLPQVPPLPRPDQIPGFAPGAHTPSFAPAGATPAQHPSSGSFHPAGTGMPAMGQPQQPLAAPAALQGRLATPIMDNSPGAGPFPLGGAPLGAQGRGSGLVAVAALAERVDHSLPAPLPQPPAQGTPLMMKITAAAGIVAALSGIVLLVYFLFIDRPASKAPPSSPALSALPEESASERRLTQPDAGAESLEFSPMEVELSPQKQRPARSRPATAQPAPQAASPKQQPGQRLSDEQRRLLALYGNAEAGSAEVPASARLPRRSEGPARQITPNEILAKQREHKPELKACYDRALKRDESLADLKAMVTITITPMGQVGQVQIDGGDNTSFTSCLQKSIKRWVFKPVGKETDIKFPIIFRGS